MFWLIVTLVIIVVGMIIEERSNTLKVGDIAPDFTASLQNGTAVSLHDFKGEQNVVLFFYPKDFTTGCTAEVCLFRDAYDEIRKLNAVIYGVSSDGSTSHKEFQKSFSLPFDLIADTSGSIGRQYGATRFGGMLKLSKRITFVIDRKGVIQLAVHHEFQIENHMNDVIAALKSLQ